MVFSQFSLEDSCKPGTHTLVLETSSAGEDSDGSNVHNTVKFDISNELEELEKDIAFLKFIESDEITNVEQFVAVSMIISHLQILISSMIVILSIKLFQTLGRFHPSGPEAFADEVEKTFDLLSTGDHFHYLFTDRDGTLKSYSCSYPASVQPAYSAVIQVVFCQDYFLIIIIIVILIIIILIFLEKCKIKKSRWIYIAVYS